MAYPLYTPDLLAAWQSRFQRENQDTGAADRLRKQEDASAMRQAQMKQLSDMGIPITSENISKLGSGFVQQGTSYVTPDPTSSMMTGEFQNWQRTKKPLSEMPGYVGGVSPEQYSAEQNAIRVAAAGVGGRGGGGSGQTAEEAALLGAQTDLAGEQARQAQYERQGRGSATADLVAQKKMEAEVANAAAMNERMMNIAEISARGKIGAATEGKEGKIGAATVTATGKKDLAEAQIPEKEYKKMEAERSALYKMDEYKWLDDAEKALIDKNLSLLYADARESNAPIPWQKIIADIMSGISALK